MMNKNEILYYYFGDEIRYLLERKMPIMPIPAILIWLIVYFRVLRPHKKGTKFTVIEKIHLGIAIVMTPVGIISQILISIGWLDTSP